MLFSLLLVHHADSFLQFALNQSNFVTLYDLVDIANEDALVLPGVHCVAKVGRAFGL